MPHVLHLPVPGTPSEATIRTGSAIVSTGETTEGRILCYWEGNLYGAANLVRYHDRANCALGRLTTRYPTIARGAIPRSDLIDIATIDEATHAIIAITDAAALTAWTEEPIEMITGTTLPEGCLATTDPRVAEAIRRMRPAGRDGRRQLYRTVAGQIIAYDPTEPNQITTRP